MAADENFFVFSHNGICVSIRLCEEVEIEFRAEGGGKPSLGIVGEGDHGIIRIRQQAAAFRSKMMLRQNECIDQRRERVAVAADKYPV